MSKVTPKAEREIGALPKCEPIEEAWARAVCTASNDKPDRMFGNPLVPAWTGWLYYARLSIKAAEALGWGPRP